MSKIRKWVLVLFVVGIGLGFSLSGASMPTLAASVQGTMPLATGACLQPPANVDLTRASDSEIAYYGLPRRPKDAQGLAQWTTSIQHAKHRSCTSVSSHEYSQSPQHSARTDARQVSPNIYTSSIWAGYVDGSGSGNGFNAVKANWNVPCNGPHSPWGTHAVTWVGIGGWYGNGYLWQGGTIDDPTWGQQLWWEAWPYNDIQFVSGIPLHCTNHIYTEADYNYSRSGGNYIFLQDISTNEYFSTTYYNGFVPNIQSAEWIDERPSCPTASELADFNYIEWSNSLAHPTGANYWGGISSFSPKAVESIDSNRTRLAQPQNLNSDGKSFTDRWYANGVGLLCG